MNDTNSTDASNTDGFLNRWAAPLGFAAAMIVAYLLLWRFLFIHNPFLNRLSPVIFVIAGYLAYRFGLGRMYETTCARLHYRFATNPAFPPRSARYRIDRLISGNFRGRAFNLFEETEQNIGSSRNTNWSVLEWTGDDIQLPAFTLDINSVTEEAEDEKGSDDGESGVRFGSGTGLAGRAYLIASDQAAVRNILTKTACDSLAGHIEYGSVEAGRGFLIFRRGYSSSGPWRCKGEFPLPWAIQDYLRRGDEVGRVLRER